MGLICIILAIILNHFLRIDVSNLGYILIFIGMEIVFWLFCIDDRLGKLIKIKSR